MPPLQPPTQALKTSAGKNVMTATRFSKIGFSAARASIESATLPITSA